MRVSDFDYHLPEELIAQQPPTLRGSSRMLVVQRATGQFADDVFTSLPAHLQAGDLLVLNDSRVLPARLFATRGGLRTQHNSPEPSGRVEVLLTQQLSEHQPAENVWSALVRPARKVQPGELLFFHDHSLPGAPAVLQAEVLAAGEFGERTLRFAPAPDFAGLLDRIGHMPLPPYIHRDKDAPDSAEDRERYQTVYSQPLHGVQAGSAAAPTAGLHFTPQVLAALHARGVEVQSLTLHVGLGTFQPVRVENVADIRLHAEHYTLPAATAQAINAARREGRRIVAVGTTTTRTLEHCGQVYGEVLEPHSGNTSIFLRPGHSFRVISGLLTNFHLPQSTLLMLVSAFAGREAVLAAYAHAVAQRYRFFSYGDCMLLL
ncbi:MAG: tRNA preQ1(34) S-adenosylmethionine ribosyltransferase-isomerase QueA [Acidobacteriota bacterium]|nr:tRNA preQ1(34) S-adenosylmethionine ribosyltransferase-isomerase QueA [Acidobacteriota bacterium]